MKKQSFLSLVAQRRGLNLKPKRTIPPKWLFPKNAEKEYDRLLHSLTTELKNLIKEFLIPEIPSMIKEVKSNTPNDRQDGYLDRLKSLIIFIGEHIQDKVKSSILGAELIGVQIARFNKTQFEKINHSVFGFDVFINEPFLADQLSLFAAQNAQLIRSIPEEELQRVAGDIERGLQQGLRFTEVAKTLQKSFGITSRRATLIARDQTTKLNSSLTQLRQQEVGVEEYIWQTSGDERVRPTHRANDGKTFRWDRPSSITGHPGHDVNCRCIARPVLDKLFNVG